MDQGEETQADFFKHSSELVTKLNNFPTENAKFCQKPSVFDNIFFRKIATKIKPFFGIKTLGIVR